MASRRGALLRLVLVAAAAATTAGVCVAAASSARGQHLLRYLRRRRRLLLAFDRAAGAGVMSCGGASASTHPQPADRRCCCGVAAATVAIVPQDPVNHASASGPGQGNRGVSNGSMSTPTRVMAFQAGPPSTEELFMVDFGGTDVTVYRLRVVPPSPLSAPLPNLEDISSQESGEDGEGEEIDPYCGSGDVAPVSSMPAAERDSRVVVDVEQQSYWIPPAHRTGAVRDLLQYVAICLADLVLQPHNSPRTPTSHPAAAAVACDPACLPHGARGCEASRSPQSVLSPRPCSPPVPVAPSSGSPDSFLSGGPSAQQLSSRSICAASSVTGGSCLWWPGKKATQGSGQGGGREGEQQQVELLLTYTSPWDKRSREVHQMKKGVLLSGKAGVSVFELLGSVTLPFQDGRVQEVLSEALYSMPRGHTVPSTSPNCPETVWTHLGRELWAMWPGVRGASC